MKWLASLFCLAQLFFLAVVQAGPQQYLDRIIEREGISMRVRMESIEDNAPSKPQVNQSVRLWIDGKRVADDQPLSNWQIGAWLDRETDTMSGAVPVCGQRVARYLSGNLIDRPLLDLTGYYVLSLDAESSVSVLDPSVSFSGRSSLYQAMKLEGKGFDWTKTSDDARLYIALPNEKKLAIADLQTFTIIDHLLLPGQPTRLMLQPDERLLWAGLTGATAQESAVAIVDTLHDKVIDVITLPSGYHEIAFSGNERYAFIANRQSQSMTIIEANTLKVVREIELGFEPLGLVFVEKQSLLWIVNAVAGRIHRYDMQGNPVDTIVLRPGLGPIKLSPDGRFVVLVNPGQHWVHILDAGTGKEKHRLTLSGQPYDVMFSEKYAYIRNLQSEQIGLLSLASLETDQPFLKLIPAGAGVMTEMQNLPRASSMALTLDRTGAFIVTPSERTLYHYMEGMNAPNSGLRTYGHTPLSAMVVQRSLREIEPGQYSAIIRIPSAGRLVLALASETPALRECLGMRIEASTFAATAEAKRIAVHWLSDTVQKVVTGESVNFRVQIKNSGDEIKSVNNVRLKVVPASGGMAAFWPMEPDSEKLGEWFAIRKLVQKGGYYVYVEADQSLQSTYSTVVVETPKDPLKTRHD